jgi:hypothetical protein
MSADHTDKKIKDRTQLVHFHTVSLFYFGREYVAFHFGTRETKLTVCAASRGRAAASTLAAGTFCRVPAYFTGLVRKLCSERKTMNDYLLRALKRLFCLVAIAAVSSVAFGSSGSVNLNGSGTLTYSVVASGLISCSRSGGISGTYRRWDFSGFVFTDVNGVSHSLPGSTAYFQANSSSPSCPPTGGESINLTDNDPQYFITATPAPGFISANLNVKLYPKYKIISILYDAPGNRSSNGYTDATNNTLSTSISQTFSNATAISITGTVLGNGAGVMFMASTSSQDTHMVQFSTSNGAGASLGSVGNSVDHTQDQFFIWLNPMVVVTPTSTTSANYSMTTPVGSNGQPQPMDIVNINAVDLENPSQIPIGVLQPQTRNNVSGLPGLADICANPVPSCTSAPCGCVPSDFATILASDPLLSISSQNTQPDQVDPNRYTFVSSEVLEGPQCDGCNPVSVTFNESDSQSTSETLTQTSSYSVQMSSSSGFQLFGSGLTLKTDRTFGWSNSQSRGSANGTSHSATITLGSTSVGCDETINIYEDTVYHTFALAPAVVSSFCN